MKTKDIKFRVWDKVDYMSAPFNLTDLQQRLIQFTSDCPIMRYIGLTDKNGKEIYEDDNVKVWYKNKEQGIYQVAWYQESCSFIMGRMLPDNSDADTIYFGNQFDYEYEVVSNIYQTKK